MIAEMECAFYTGAIVFMDQQANIVASHQEEDTMLEGQQMMEELVADIISTYEEKSRYEEQQLLAEGVIDRIQTPLKPMVN